MEGYNYFYIHPREGKMATTAQGAEHYRSLGYRTIMEPQGFAESNIAKIGYALLVTALLGYAATVAFAENIKPQKHSHEQRQTEKSGIEASLN